MTHVDMYLLTSCNCGQHERCHEDDPRETGEGPRNYETTKVDPTNAETHLLT